MLKKIFVFLGVVAILSGVSIVVRNSQLKSTNDTELITKTPTPSLIQTSTTIPTPTTNFLDIPVGKPVLYFYPIRTTDIIVKLGLLIHDEITIPSYGPNGWYIRAFTDGSLKDLQPKLTNCDHIDIYRHGSEYAKKACKKNIYPYIYWTGHVPNQYPKQQYGWYVSKKDVKKFLENTLTKIGFTPTEKNDMVSYWAPKLQSIHPESNWYRISFLQTEEVNDFIPMTISPRPDTLYRIFMDYEALNDKPQQPILPQQLVPIIRDGFTVVEWGGLLEK
ncbi:MAG: hypothetical protein WCO06_07355 [Candidatus Roizmanbacteria bacterium]